MCLSVDLPVFWHLLVCISALMTEVLRGIKYKQILISRRLSQSEWIIEKWQKMFYNNNNVIDCGRCYRGEEDKLKKMRTVVVVTQLESQTLMGYLDK